MVVPTFFIRLHHAYPHTDHGFSYAFNKPELYRVGEKRKNLKSFWGPVRQDTSHVVGW